MRRRLHGRTVLVTGGARRIGRAIVVACAEAGAGVVIHHRRSGKAARELAGTLRTAGGRAWTLDADLADDAGCASLIDRAIELAGPLDVLVNSASVFPGTRAGGMTRADLEEAVRINAWAPYDLSRRFARCARGGASVVNLLDTRVRGHDRSHAAYHASKVLLATFTRTLAVELAPRVRVNAVAPGPILRARGETVAAFERAGRAAPLERTGRPRDVADAVVYLAGADYVTGQVVFVDGGRHVRDGGGAAAESRRKGRGK